jgi:hypothetical protein
MLIPAAQYNPSVHTVHYVADRFEYDPGLHFLGTLLVELSHQWPGGH